MRKIIAQLRSILSSFTLFAKRSLKQGAICILTLLLVLGCCLWHPSAASVTIGLHSWHRYQWSIELCMMILLLLGMVVLQLEIVKAKEREYARVLEEQTADLRHANDELLRLSHFDSLTGVANRRAFDVALEREHARMQRSNNELSLALIDLDHFKLVNDTGGHARGDEFLVRLAAVLQKSARRPGDLAARIGGEEFALILPETSAVDALQIAESTRGAIVNLRLPNSTSPTLPYLTISVGVATTTSKSVKSLIAAADRALYEAKRAGRNRVIVDAESARESNTQKSEQPTSI
jgi:diguanylate cyclase (GGDEF)-like protein